MHNYQNIFKKNFYYENNADFIHPDDIDIVADLFQIENEEMLMRVFRMRAGKDFNYRYFNAKVIPLTVLPTGEIDLVLCVAIDITDMIDIEKELISTIDRLRIENEKERNRLYKYNKMLLLELEQLKNDLFKCNTKFSVIQETQEQIKENMLKIDSKSITPPHISNFRRD